MPLIIVINKAAYTALIQSEQSSFVVRNIHALCLMFAAYYLGYTLIDYYLPRLHMITDLAARHLPQDFMFTIAICQLLS